MHSDAAITRSTHWETQQVGSCTIKKCFKNTFCVFNLSNTAESVLCKYNPKGTPQMNKPSVCSGVWNRYDVHHDGGYFPTFTLLSCSCGASLQISLLKSKARRKGPMCSEDVVALDQCYREGYWGKMSFLQLSWGENIFYIFTAGKGRVNAKVLK